MPMESGRWSDENGVGAINMFGTHNLINASGIHVNKFY